MDSSKIISLEDLARKENRYPAEEEALKWALELCRLVGDKNGEYPLISPKNIYIENGNRWTLAQAPTTSDPSEALFRLGAVLHYLLTRSPFRISHYLDGPPPIRERNPQISVRLEAMITRLLQNVRALRYSDVHELREELERLQKELEGEWEVQWACFKGDSSRTNFLSDPDFQPKGKTLKEVWRAAVGEIWSSPVMAGENLYFGSGDGNFYCLDAQTGKTIWKLPLNARIESTACISESTAYVGNDLGALYAINIKSGSLLWRRNLGEYVRSSPYCDGKKVYVGSIHPINKSGFLWALDPESGSVLWKRPMGPVFSSPVVDRNEVLIGSDDENLYCFSPAGDLKWKLSLRGKVRSTAVLARNFIFAGGFGGALLKIRRSTHQVVWKNECGSMYSSPAYARSFIAVGNNSGKVCILQSSTGKNIAEFASGGPVTSSPLIVNQHILIGSNDGNFYVLDSTASLVSSFDAKAPINSSAYYMNQVIYVGSDSGLHALSL